ncbi:MAG: hypothetical protein KY468_06040 [Armatimonadetes bacterium]|nr:hypothetical protein [Armatimonadota bacterium]
MDRFRAVRRAAPPQAQMLGKITHTTVFYLPKEEDIPLKRWLEERKDRMRGGDTGSQASNGIKNLPQM